MKKLFPILALRLSAFCFLLSALALHAQPTPVAPATAAEVSNGVVRTKFVSPATLASAGGLSNGVLRATAVTVGTGASTFTLTATNASAPIQDGLPLVYWSQYINYNTNLLFIRSHPQAGMNAIYTNLGTWYSNLTVTTRYATNIGNWYALVFNGTANTSNTVGFASTSWAWMVGGSETNMFVVSTYGTNTCWNLMAWGGATNISQLTNGAGGMVYSNGAAYQVTSRVGATNTSWLLILAAP